MSLTIHNNDQTRFRAGVATRTLTTWWEPRLNFLSVSDHRSTGCPYQTPTFKDRYQAKEDRHVEPHSGIKKKKKKHRIEHPPRMKLPRIFFALGVTLLLLNGLIAAPSPQEPAFEIPVQLVGFPVIIAAVRLTNFVKKLAYSLNPDTYVSRVRRSTGRISNDEEFLDVGEVEKRLVNELGEGVCVYERVCSKYAGKSLQKSKRDRVMDWDYIFSRYKISPDPMKENYLLSVFLGEIVASPRLCHQLAKRGRGCDDNTLKE